MNPANLIVEASIATLRAALDAGHVSSVELVTATLVRIANFDRASASIDVPLNSVVVLDPHALEAAAAADARIRAGRPLSLLDGIPYTAKESYAAAGLTVAAGSPAFANLRAGQDAFMIERLRAAGAVLIGLTNMPPMANGGMQRGVHGRAESPYNPDWLVSAFASGSSNGSGAATAASIGTFGLAEETWSSGRAPASSNALCAYTPSRGVLSMRGNWPLVPTMDVAVPHARSMADLLAILDVTVADDHTATGDFWRMQPWLDVPLASEHRPDSYAALAQGTSLAGKTFGIPRMYIGLDTAARAPIETHPDVVAAWQSLRDELTAAGARVVECELPLVSNYEGDRDGAPHILNRGLVPPEYIDVELWELSVWGWDSYLRNNADPALSTLADVNGDDIFPVDPGAVADQFRGISPAFDPAGKAVVAEYPSLVSRVGDLADVPCMQAGLAGLEATREADWDLWLDAQGFDAVIFPAVADVGAANADRDVESARLAWRNGTWVANGNLVWRHFGIPTVTVPMGMMESKGMPVGVTIAGRPYDDAALLGLGAAIEALRPRRIAPPLPAIDAACVAALGGGPATVTVSAVWESGAIVATGSASGAELRVWIAGRAVQAVVTDGSWRAELAAEAVPAARIHSPWEEPHGVLVVAQATANDGAASGAFVELAYAS